MWGRVPLGIHTGEDWNGRGGGDTDIGQPVMAVATGKVVVARRFPNPWGFVVMIEHIVLDGHDKRRVRSQYAHLSRIDVKEGQIVHGRDVIGAIGKDPDGAYPAHLHLEIRSDVTRWGRPTGRRITVATATGSENTIWIRARSSARTESCPIRPRSRSWCWWIRRATACRSGWAGA